jgi:TRAP-type C4-dicarboxylate transport system permease small subunit
MNHLYKLAFVALNTTIYIASFVAYFVIGYIAYNEFSAALASGAKSLEIAAFLLYLALMIVGFLMTTKWFCAVVKATKIANLN